MKRYGKDMERSGCRMQVHINECVKKKLYWIGTKALQTLKLCLHVFQKIL